MSSHKPLTGKHIAQAVAMGLAGAFAFVSACAALSEVVFGWPAPTCT